MPEAFYRQRNWLTKPLDRVLLIGAGTIGSWTALCLDKIGCGSIWIMDDDTIEPHNLANQYLTTATIDTTKKVYALQETLTTVYPIPKRFTLQNSVEFGNAEFDAVIVATDNMHSRFEAAQYARQISTLLLDARLGQSMIEAYCIQAWKPAQFDWYLKLAHDFNDANTPDLPDCGQVSTAALGMAVASCIVQSLVDCHCKRDFAKFRLFNLANGIGESEIEKVKRRPPKIDNQAPARETTSI